MCFYGNPPSLRLMLALCSPALFVFIGVPLSIWMTEVKKCNADQSGDTDVFLVAF